MSFEKIHDKKIISQEAEKESAEDFHLKESAILTILVELRGKPKFEEPKYLNALRAVIKVLEVKAEFAKSREIFPFGHEELKSDKSEEIKERIDKIFWEKAAFIEAGKVTKKLAEAVKEDKHYIAFMQVAKFLNSKVEALEKERERLEREVGKL